MIFGKENRSGMKKNAMFGIFGYLVLFVIFIATAEAVLRITGVVETWMERNGGDYIYIYNKKHDSWFWTRPKNSTTNYEQKEFSFERKTNSEGIRDIDHPKEKPADEFRIITIGDSFTEGHGVAFEDGWAKVLEKKLNESSPDKKIRMIMGGVSGSDPIYGYKLLEKRLLEYDPDLVIVAINKSDIDDIAIRGGADRFLPDGTSAIPKGSNRLEKYWAKCHLLRAIMKGVFRYDNNLMSPDERTARRKQALRMMVDAAKAFRELGNREGFEFLLVTHPMIEEASGNEMALEFIEGEIVKNKIEHLNLLEYYNDQLGDDRYRILEYYWPMDKHHNKEGYELFASGVAKKLNETDYLGAASQID